MSALDLKPSASDAERLAFAIATLQDLTSYAHGIDAILQAVASGDDLDMLTAAELSCKSMGLLADVAVCKLTGNETGGMKGGNPVTWLAFHALREELRQASARVGGTTHSDCA